MLTGINTCHLLKMPNGRWGFVGRIPAALCDTRDATQADVMAGRSYRGQAGELLSLYTRVHDTEAEARADAGRSGVTLAN